jgi:hypothetical protein
MRVMRAALAHPPALAVVGEHVGRVPEYDVFRDFFKETAARTAGD